MLTDMGTVARCIKPYADSTLHNVRKADLIAYIRCLENNYNTAATFNENQARYIESLSMVEVRCKECQHWTHTGDGLGDCTHERFAVPGVCCPTMPADSFCSLGERRPTNGNV